MDLHGNQNVQISFQPIILSHNPNLVNISDNLFTSNNKVNYENPSVTETLSSTKIRHMVLDEIPHQFFPPIPENEAAVREGTLQFLAAAWIEFMTPFCPESFKYLLEVIPYGSEQLGSCTPGSDMDLYLVAPKDQPKSRDELLEGFSKFLLNHPTFKSRTKTCYVVHARVPIISWQGIEVNGISQDVDLNILFLKLFLDMSKKPSLHDVLTHTFQNDYSDDLNVSAINGWKTSDMILAIVKPRLHEFQHALRFLKRWSKVRCISGYTFGYFNGISLAILLSYVYKYILKEQSVTWLSLVKGVFKYLINCPIEKSHTILSLHHENMSLRTENLITVLNQDMFDSLKQCPLSILTPFVPISNTTKTMSTCSFRRVSQEASRALDLLSESQSAKNNINTVGPAGSLLYSVESFESVFQPFHPITDTITKNTHFIVFKVFKQGVPELKTDFLNWLDIKWVYYTNRIERYVEHLKDSHVVDDRTGISYQINAGLQKSLSVPIHVYLYPKRILYTETIMNEGKQINTQVAAYIYGITMLESQEDFSRIETTIFGKPILPLAETCSRILKNLYSHQKMQWGVVVKPSIYVHPSVNVNVPSRIPGRYPDKNGYYQDRTISIPVLPMEWFNSVKNMNPTNKDIEKDAETFSAIPVTFEEKRDQEKTQADLSKA